MASHSETIGNEVYVWMNGNLIYKKWLNTNNSIVFNDYGHPTWKGESRLSITDDNVEEYRERLEASERLRNAVRSAIKDI